MACGLTVGLRGLVRPTAALGHDLDRQAAVEIGRRGFPILEIGLVAGDQRIEEGVVLRLVHRAVDVVGAVAAGPDLVVARLEPGDVHVDRVEIDDRCDGVEEGERVGAGQSADRLGKAWRGEGAGGDDDIVPFGRRQAVDLAAVDGDERVILERLGDGLREALAVDGERAAGGHLVRIAHAHDERVRHAQLRVQQADGIGVGVVRAERVGADELGQAVRLVRVGAAHGPHLVQDDGNAAIDDLPSGFGAGETAADDVNGVCFHGAEIIAPERREQLRRFAMRPGQKKTPVGEEVDGRSLWVALREGGGSLAPYRGDEGGGSSRANSVSVSNRRSAWRSA